MNNVLVAINAKYIHSNLACLSLKSYAASKGQHAQIAEYTINQPMQQILADLFRHNPDVLFFSCYIWNMELVQELTKEFHKINPSIPIYLGGPEVAFRAEEYVQEHPEIAGVMVGEGEVPFTKICQFYDRIGDYDKIPGLVWVTENGRVEVQAPAMPLALDEIPFCYPSLDGLDHKIIYYESSRGCPFSCTYCISSIDRHLRFRSLDKVFEELQFFLDHKVTQVKFIDRTFNCNGAHALAIWRYILEHDNGVTNFQFEIAADLLKADHMRVLSKMRPGLVQLEIGIQTTNFETIREIHRTMSVGRVEEAVMAIHKMNNIHQHLDLIAGLPYEDYESFQNSFEDVYRLEPDQLQLGFLKVLRGSYMYEHAQEYGLVYTDKPPYEVLQSKWVTYGQMLNLKLVEEMVETYYNTGQFRATLPVVETMYDTAFEFYLHLGAFYASVGWMDKKVSRLHKYVIVLQLVKNTAPELFDLVKETLLYDYYLREKAKKRPKWAPDISGQKKEIARALRLLGYEQKYCDLQPFTIPVWEIERGKPFPKCGDKKWVLFDYENRDVITNNAKVIILEELPSES
ncbi:Radical SAM superfamily enzyme YgiQ, UPF0313 family [Eubacterium oxidoreducens]|uniref:Radical SAM superfamily enzyme YgiQ, UPF0313 family n=2 Tax=Eubacterium oxidoreducens TaxID=1732 RepID=A0A1G6CA04_EUBOX|nr:Radical SAM superfamily enzyme YgiQ, UPF0313 family [Eubacterium oxidoreducens]